MRTVDDLPPRTAALRAEMKPELQPRFSTLRGDVVITWRDGEQLKFTGGKWVRLADVGAIKP